MQEAEEEQLRAEEEAAQLRAELSAVQAGGPGEGKGGLTGSGGQPSPRVRSLPGADEVSYESILLKVALGT